MAKLAKKKTMIETIIRVVGYSYKLMNEDKISWKLHEEVNRTLAKLRKALDK